MHVAIIGCGQLARMMALAGWNLGIKFSFLAEPDESTRCVEGLGSVTRRGADATAREIFMALGAPDVVTVERENVDLELLRGLEHLCAVYPGADAVAAPLRLATTPGLTEPGSEAHRARLGPATFSSPSSTRRCG